MLEDYIQQLEKPQVFVIIVQSLLLRVSWKDLIHKTPRRGGELSDYKKSSWDRGAVSRLGLQFTLRSGFEQLI